VSLPFPVERRETKWSRVRIWQNLNFHAQVSKGFSWISLPIANILIQAIMRPIDLQPIGQELAVKWEDGSESFISLEKLRRACPCAGCKGESDILGNLYKGPDQALTSRAFELRSLTRIGTYALQPVWADGHSTGLYTFDYLKHLAEGEK
jgi:DUF971 family protein